MFRKSFIFGVFKITFLMLVIILAGCSTTTTANREKVTLTGNVEQITLVEKNFTVVGIIFLTSTATIDSNGSIIDGSPVTYEMLMKEAQNLGADDIANLRIDEIQKNTEIQKLSLEHIDHQQSITTVSQRIIAKREITYNATALAIKYVN
jgi:hypothetical protein